MCASILIAVVLAAPAGGWPVVAADTVVEGGDSIAAVDLRHWWAHEGQSALVDVPPLAPVVDLSRLEAAFDGRGGAEEGWYRFEVPQALSREGTEGRLFYLVTRFRLAPGAEGLPIALWLGRTTGAVTAYVNGTLVMRRGRGGERLWSLDNTAAGTVLPASSLRLGRLNTVLLRVESPTAGFAFPLPAIVPPLEVSVRQDREIDATVRIYWGATTVLGAVAVYYLILFLMDLRRREYLYFTIGTLGYALTMWILSVEWTQLSTVELYRWMIPALGASSPFYVLFFQRLYRIHEHPLWAWICVGATIVLTLLALSISTIDGLFAALLGSLPYGTLAFLYAIWLNLKAWRSGSPDAPPVLLGLLAFIAIAAVDMVRVGQGHFDIVVIYPVGVLAFVLGVFVAIARRSQRLTREVEASAERLSAREQAQARLIERMQEMAREVESAAASLVAASRQQEAGAASQSSVVEETLRSMETLSAAAAEIDAAARAVLQNAEASRKQSRELSSRVTSLGQHAARIDEIVALVQEIASKADIVSLNAALEGVKAGESGRGFTLVAAEMQRLAERVIDAVTEIRRFTEDIDQANAETEASAKEAFKLAVSTAGSARKISLATREQAAGAEGVTEALEGAAEVAKATAESSRELLVAAERLQAIAMRLRSAE